ncbi:MAG: hypothetical protein J6K91_05835 [Opitutales bacterium]|nr:hypothetical protein [Opitutales bacterium]
MKKLITIMLSATIALCAFAAKDLNTLVAEYAPIVQDKAFKAHFEASGEFIKANLNDLLDAFNVWKNTDYAKFAESSESYQKASAAEKQQFKVQQRLFARLADVAAEEMSASDACILRIGSGNPVFLTANEGAYQRAKANNFLTEGVQLPYYRIVVWAKHYGDYDVINALPIDKCADIKEYLQVKTAKLRRIADVSAAISQCEEIENWYLDRNREVPAIVQATLASLTKKLARSKLK